MRLVFARHGQSEANLLREFSNRGLKHGLTPRGLTEAHQLAERLRGTDVQALYASPLLRAIQTAAILSESLRIPYEVTDALREYDCGILEGTSDEAGWQLYDMVLHEWLINHNWRRRIQDGESFLDMQSRFVPFITELVTAHRNSESTLLLVGHGGLYRCMLPLILENVNFTFTLSHGLGNAEIVVADLTNDGFVCRSWGALALA